jgi:putative addiction module killer protein
LRCFFGGGIRMYCTIRGNAVVLMLAGGDKDSQGRDIGTVKEMMKEMED